jgi:hypothetical protein
MLVTKSHVTWPLFTFHACSHLTNVFFRKNNPYAARKLYTGCCKSHLTFDVKMLRLAWKWLSLRPAPIREPARQKFSVYTAYERYTLSAFLMTSFFVSIDLPDASHTPFCLAVYFQSQKRFFSTVEKKIQLDSTYIQKKMFGRFTVITAVLLKFPVWRNITLSRYTCFEQSNTNTNAIPWIQMQKHPSKLPNLPVDTTSVPDFNFKHLQLLSN